MRFIGGDDGKVFIVNPGVRLLGVFEWGKKPDAPGVIASPKFIATPRFRDLCRCLLFETLDDEVRATKNYQNFMHHSMMAGWWQWAQPWTRIDAEIVALLAEIERAVKEGGHLTMATPREAAIIPAAGSLALPTNIKGTPSSGYGGNDTAPDRRRK